VSRLLNLLLRLVAFLLFLNPQCLASISRWITASSSWKRFCLFVCRALSSIMVICSLVRFESSSVPTTLPTAYDVYPLDGRHDGGYYTVKDCVTIDVLPRTPGNNVYVGFMVWSNFTATKCRGLVSLNQVIKEIICLQP